MKIGRNQPCFCGSGVKFKRCHGRLTDQDNPIEAAIQRLKQVNSAKERVRVAQQGHGKPILSANRDDQRIVAVGKTGYQSSSWTTFPEFLSDYLKIKFGREWWYTEFAKPFEDRHILFQWLDAIDRLQKRTITKPDVLDNRPLTGAFACYFSLAYGLYLLDHNVELQNRLLARLKNRGNFQGAYYELLVARTFIRAGFTLTLENEADGDQQHCEFSAISPGTGRKYWVEAKARAVAGELGKTEADGTTSNKPLSSLTRQLRNALLKPASDARMIFLDLNAEMEAGVSEDNQPALIVAARERLERYEQETLKPGEAAYVFVTNANFHKNLDRLAQSVALPYGLGIPDYNRPGFYRLSELYKKKKLHADALQVEEALTKLLTFPVTFDGSLPSVSLYGAPPPVVIGETYDFGKDATGNNVVGAVVGAFVEEEQKAAFVTINSTDGRCLVVRQPMTNQQLADHRAHPDAYFGKVERPSGGAKNQYELFEWLMHSLRHLPRETLLGYLNGQVTDAETMETDDLLALLCEGTLGVFQVKDGLIEPSPL